MPTVVFGDGVRFELTTDQLRRVPYFRACFDSSFRECKADVIDVKQSSVGFEYIYTQLTLECDDLYDPKDRLEYVLKQCDYFGCEELSRELVEKYGYRDEFVEEIPERIGVEKTFRMIFRGKFSIRTVRLDYTSTQRHFIQAVVDLPKFHRDGAVNEVYKKRYQNKIGDKILRYIFSSGLIPSWGLYVLSPSSRENGSYTISRNPCECNYTLVDRAPFPPALPKSQISRFLFEDSGDGIRSSETHYVKPLPCKDTRFDVNKPFELYEIIS